MVPPSSSSSSLPLPSSSPSLTVPNPNTLPTRKKSTPPGAQHAAATDATRRMVCGGLAGMIAKTATNPLERIKMLSQTGEHGGAVHSSVLNLYRNILQREGILGLWAGNGINLIRIFPAKAVVFSSNDFYRNLLFTWTDHNTIQPRRQQPQQHVREENIRQLSAPLSFLAGGLSGMTASAVTYPLDLARGRISGKIAGIGTTTTVRDGTTARPKKVYGGMIQTIAMTVKDEGFFALYKGITPTLLGAMPYEGIKFGTVGLMEKLLPFDHNSDVLLSNRPLRKMLFGGLGGVMAGVITYPNDTVRRLLQLQGSRGTSSQFSGYWDCVRQTYRQHGLTRFYRGLLINIVRMAPNAAVQFGSYELLKEWSEPYF